MIENKKEKFDEGNTSLRNTSTNVPTPTTGSSNWTFRSSAEGSYDRMRSMDLNRCTNSRQFKQKP